MSQEFQIAGFELVPGTHNRRLTQPIVEPVLTDRAGNHFISIPAEDRLVAFPFIVGSKVKPTGQKLNAANGFVPLEDMPKQSSGDDGGFGDMMSAMMQQMPQQLGTDWVGHAAKSLMLGGGPGGLMDATLRTLGVQNPLAGGPLGAALGGALQAAGLSPMRSLLPSVGALLQGAGGDAVAGAMGSAGLGSLLQTAGLGNIPGLGTVSSLVGRELGEGLNDLFSDGGLDQLGDSISGLMGDPAGSFAPMQNSIDPHAIGAGALDEAANYLASQWQVDDESSAAEHIAHKAVMDHKGVVQSALKEEIVGKGGGVSGLADRVKGFFTGVPPGSGQPAVRIGDVDSEGDVCVQGICPIKVACQPVSRITDKVVGPKAPAPGKQIVIGEPSVLSAGLPTAFLLSLTEVPSVMNSGACTVLVGGAAVAAMQQAAKAASVNSNGGPATPKAPKSPSSSASSPPAGPQGEQSQGEAGDARPGETAGEPGGGEQAGGLGGGEASPTANDGEPSDRLEQLDKEKEAIDRAAKSGKIAEKVKEAKADIDAHRAKEAAQQNAQDLESRAEESKSEYEAKRQQADELQRQADGQHKSGQNLREQGEAIRTQQDANAADRTADRAGDRFDSDAAKANEARASANNLPDNAPRSRWMHGVDGVDKGLKGAGIGLDVLATGNSVLRMDELAKQGEDRAVIREAGGTIGGLAGGLAGAKAGALIGAGLCAPTGPGAAVCGGIGALAGGMIGATTVGALGDQAGDAVADYTGHENRSGTRQNTWYDNFQNGVQVISNGQVGEVTGWW